jgi:tripartite-type tricarboxylate transporter receptor subunit TctC
MANLMIKSILIFLLYLCATNANAQESYPNKPIRLYVGFAPGGGTDIAARIIAPYLSKELGQPVVIENKPGVGGNIATEIISKSPPDGYLIMLSSVGPLAYSPHIFKLGYDPLKDLTPIGLGVTSGNALIINPQQLKAKTLAEFVAIAEKTPGGVAYGSSGAGSGGHLAGELFAATAKINLVHIAYRGGGPAINDLLGGTVPSLFATIITAKQLIESGKVTALAVTSHSRSKALPNVPTIAELGYPGYEAANWYAFIAPPKTPAAIVSKLNIAINKALRDPQIKERLLLQGLDPTPSSPEEMASYLKKEYTLWGGVIAKAGIKIDN